MKIKGLLLSLALACGIAGGVYATAHVGGNTRTEIRAAPNTADQIVTALNLQLHSFNVSLPQGKYLLHVWMEHWTRGAKEPQIQILATMGISAEKENLLTVLIPTTERRESYVAWNGELVRTASVIPIDLNKINGISILEPRNVVIGDPLPLAALVTNKSGIVTAGTERVEQEHDDTYYLRASFSAGDDRGQSVAKWKDGKVVFN